MAEREEISRGVAAGEPCRQIAARLGRAPSTVSRELASIHGQVTAHPGHGVAKYHNTYSPDPANLGHVTQPALLDALQQILAGCQTLLRPGGLLC